MSLRFRVVDYKSSIPAVQKFGEKLTKIEFVGHIENLGPGGVLFTASEQSFPINENVDGFGKTKAAVFAGEILEAGNILDLRIDLPDEAKPVECMAKILRVVRVAEAVALESRFNYHVAGLFLVIHSVDRSRLEKFCSQQGSDETI